MAEKDDQKSEINPWTGTLEKARPKPTASHLESQEYRSLLQNCIEFPFRLLWNTIIIVAAISLEIIWIGFLLGSVLGIVLLLIFFPEGFLLPLDLLFFTKKLWPEINKNNQP